eukprot:TRINITY_DN3977_c0_g3_i1.p1 TRINITY_DN3977_c0_g3~~TRINITY_DN3977_c0_g3_i1.p1  ORF type:complete len:516 (-),score=84.61 TRINITY_DN3977_c0_g3_i1:674-2221(-)
MSDTLKEFMKSHRLAEDEPRPPDRQGNAAGVKPARPPANYAQQTRRESTHAALSTPLQNTSTRSPDHDIHTNQADLQPYNSKTTMHHDSSSISIGASGTESPTHEHSSANSTTSNPASSSAHWPSASKKLRSEGDARDMTAMSHEAEGHEEMQSHTTHPPLRNQLSEVQRATILRMHAEGKSLRVIARSIGCTLSSVQYTVHKFERHKTIQNLPKSGRSRLLATIPDNDFFEIVQGTSGHTLMERLANISRTLEPIINHPASTKTVYNEWKRRIARYPPTSSYPRPPSMTEKIPKSSSSRILQVVASSVAPNPALTALISTKGPSPGPPVHGQQDRLFFQPLVGPYAAPAPTFTKDIHQRASVVRSQTNDEQSFNHPHANLETRSDPRQMTSSVFYPTAISGQPTAIGQYTTPPSHPPSHPPPTPALGSDSQTRLQMQGSNQPHMSMLGYDGIKTESHDPITPPIRHRSGVPSLEHPMLLAPITSFSPCESLTETDDSDDSDCDGPSNVRMQRPR